MTDSIDYKSLVMAIECALASVRNEAGGYSEEEKSRTIIVLDALLTDAMKKYNG